MNPEEPSLEPDSIQPPQPAELIPPASLSPAESASTDAVSQAPATEPVTDTPTEAPSPIVDLSASALPSAVQSDEPPVESESASVAESQSQSTSPQPVSQSASQVEASPAQPAPQSTVPAVQSAPAAALAWDPHSAEEINYLKTTLGPKAWASHRARTAARLEKIMELVRKKGTIDRTDVRLALDVSPAAATRYLAALVKQGKLKRRHTQNDNVYTLP